MPILTFESLEQVPEGLREAAKADDADGGKIKVNVVAAGKVDEFRDNNIKLSKERDDLLNSLTPLREIVGEDPAAFRTKYDELKAMADRVAAGELKESRQLEEAVGKRTEEMRRQYDEQLKQQAADRAAWQTKANSFESQWKRAEVVGYIRDAIAANPELHDRASQDVIRRGLDVFRYLDSGAIEPFAPGGTEPVRLYGADGVSPMTAAEWIKTKLKEEAPYLFKQSSGGGAGGNGGGGGDTLVKDTKFTKAQLAAMSPRERLAAINGEPGARL